MPKEKNNMPKTRISSDRFRMDFAVDGESELAEVWGDMSLDTSKYGKVTSPVMQLEYMAVDLSVSEYEAMVGCPKTPVNLGYLSSVKEALEADIAAELARAQAEEARIEGLVVAEAARAAAAEGVNVQALPRK